MKRIKLNSIWRNNKDEEIHKVLIVEDDEIVTWGQKEYSWLSEPRDFLENFTWIEDPKDEKTI